MKKSAKTGFSTPITKFEGIIGFFLLAIHIFALPPLLRWLPGALGADWSERTVNLIYYGVSFLLTAGFLFRFLRNSFRAFFDRFGNTLISIIVGFVAYYGLLYLLSLAVRLISGSSGLPEASAIADMAKLNPDAMAVISLLLAPIVEETLFRGVAFGVTRKKSRVLAYILSLLLFAIYHIFWSVVGSFSWQLLATALYYLPASLVLCWVYDRTGSVWAPIVLHILINCVSLYLVIG